MPKKKKKKNKNKQSDKNNVEIWTEEQYEEYLMGLYGMESIAGFTDGGVPFGIFKENDDPYDDDHDDDNVSANDDSSAELPF